MEEQVKQSAVKSKAVKSRSKKKKAKVSTGKICINATFNNTIISITDSAGNVVAWSTAGHTGFKGSRKSTPYAGQRTMESLLPKVKEMGLTEAEVLITGLGAGRESALRALHGSGVAITAIRDLTPVAHAGVRPKKPRRL